MESKLIINMSISKFFNKLFLTIHNLLIKFFRSIRDFFKSIEIEDFELSPEREDELIEKITLLIVNNKLEMPATLLLYGLEPGSTMLSQMVILPLTPYLDMIGVQGFELVTLFENKNNIRRIRNRIKELEK